MGSLLTPSLDLDRTSESMKRRSVFWKDRLGRPSVLSLFRS
ncbi:MAG: hypothetical protein OJF51_000656 [Nitrospira sp.]|nr:MAG: hypothetical protein OJF51_000656 [Nitrospira sp.]